MAVILVEEGLALGLRLDVLAARIAVTVVRVLIGGTDMAVHGIDPSFHRSNVSVAVPDDPGVMTLNLVNDWLDQKPAQLLTRSHACGAAHPLAWRRG